MAIWHSIKLKDCCKFEKGSSPIAKSIPGQYPLIVTGKDPKSCNKFQFDCEAVCIP